MLVRKFFRRAWKFFRYQLPLWWEDNGVMVTMFTYGIVSAVFALITYDWVIYPVSQWIKHNYFQDSRLVILWLIALGPVGASVALGYLELRFVRKTLGWIVTLILIQLMAMALLVLLAINVYLAIGSGEEVWGLWAIIMILGLPIVRYVLFHLLINRITIRLVQFANDRLDKLNRAVDEHSVNPVLRRVILSLVAVLVALTLR